MQSSQQSVQVDPNRAQAGINPLPQVIPGDLLKMVSGGSPKGGWSPVQTEALYSPKGGW